MSQAMIALLLLSLCILHSAPAAAQGPPGPLAGEWRAGPRSWVVTIEQDGMKVRGSWKELYRDKQVTCSGVWFEGTISGDRITGNFNPCGGNVRTEPLNMKILDENTLEVATMAPGGTPRTTRLQRIK